MARVKGKAAVEKKNSALEKLNIEYVTPDKVTPNDYNPNRQSEHDFNLLLKSMEEDGFTQPIIVAEDYTIVDGEHRWRAAHHLGIPEIPIVRVPMDAAQARIATLRHNRARGSEDIELAVDVLRDLEKLGALEWAQDSLELTDDELNRLLEDIPAPEALAAEEFSEAWVPDKAPRDIELKDAQLDSTPAAANHKRILEAKLAEARTQEERDIVNKERAIYRLSLTFTNEEATVVKQALGDTPAAIILNWCTEAVNQTTTD